MKPSDCLQAEHELPPTYGTSHERDQGITSRHSLTRCQIYYSISSTCATLSLIWPPFSFLYLRNYSHDRTYKNLSLSVGIEVEMVAIVLEVG